MDPNSISNFFILILGCLFIFGAILYMGLELVYEIWDKEICHDVARVVGFLTGLDVGLLLILGSIFSIKI